MAGEVAIVGAGQSRFGVLKEGIKSLFAQAFFECLDSVDKGMDPRQVQEAFVGSMSFGGGQLGNLAALMTEQVGLTHIPARKVENACASSSYALRDAWFALHSGMLDVVLVAGVEKMTDLPSDRRRYWLGVSGDTEWERLAGTTFAGLYALMASRHMHEYGTKRESLAQVAVKNHRYASHNPKAHFQRPIKLEQVLEAPMLAQPLTLYDSCPVSDGASALLLTRAELAKSFTDSPVYIQASSGASDFLALHDREDITRVDGTVKAAKEAYRQAHLSPGEVDMAEIHDAFTIGEIMALEDLGFCSKGQGGVWTLEGRTEIGGDIAVNTSGGLKAKGHPLGATGAGQVVEVFKQLRSEAEKARQVSGAEVALTHNVGGSGATVAVHIFSR
ncbi:MAG: thiolase domain-containing protein [Candidatus Thermoplasmatota archaeon]|nr:thiolase domain-containing protein [Candidatus Thermoplasmatota archaeon]